MFVVRIELISGRHSYAGGKMMQFSLRSLVKKIRLAWVALCASWALYVPVVAELIIGMLSPLVAGGIFYFAWTWLMRPWLSPVLPMNFRAWFLGARLG